MEVNANINFGSIVPNWTLLLDLVNHELPRIDNDCLKIIYKELKKKVEQGIIEREALIKKLSSGRKKISISFQKESDESNITQCWGCGIDTFDFYICEGNTKKDFANYSYYCLRCASAERMLNKLREHNKRYEFYYKYEQAQLSNFFKRIESKLTCKDPNKYQDSGIQIPLLTKADWPQLRTKEDLEEEGTPCIFYGDSKKKQVKDGISITKSLHSLRPCPRKQEIKESENVKT